MRLHLHLHLHLSHNQLDRWGADADLATILLHSSRFSSFLRVSLSVRPVHSGMLSSHLLFCRPLLLPPCTVPCKNVLERPDDWEMCPYHISLHFFHCGKKVFVGSNALLNSALYFHVGDMISVGDAK